MDSEIESLKLLKKAAEECDSVLVLTGAGASAESGIPTFRGSTSAWYAGVTGAPILGFFATPIGWENAPWLAWPFYDRWMRRPMMTAQPNAFHRWVGELHAAGKSVFVMTQNVDGMHQKGGVPTERVHEIHGTVWKSVCSKCHAVISATEPVNGAEPPDVDYCSLCGGWPRPGALLFSVNAGWLGGSETYHPPSSAVMHYYHTLPGKTMTVIAGLSGFIASVDGMIQTAAVNGAQWTFNINPAVTKYENENITTIRMPCARAIEEMKNLGTSEPAEVQSEE